MNYVEIVIAVLGIAVAAGGVAAWFARGRGKETIQLMQTNVDAYKDAERLKDQRIAYLEGQVVSKDNTIQALTDKAVEIREARYDRK